MMKKNIKIRDNMLPVLGPKGGEEEVEALREVIQTLPKGLIDKYDVTLDTLYEK